MAVKLTDNRGPVFGVQLLDTLPIGTSGKLQQAMPSADELRQVKNISDRTVAAYEVLTDHYRELVSTLRELHDFGERSCHYRNERRSKEAFDRAIKLLKKLGG